MAQLDTIPKLTKLPLFAGATNEALSSFVKTCRHVELGPDATVFKEGDKGTFMLIIVDGHVRISCQEGSVILGTLGPGQIFGEMAVIDPAPRTAAAKTTTHASLLCLERDVFKQLVQTCDPVAVKLLSAMGDMMANRLSNLDDRIARTIRKLGGGSSEQEDEPAPTESDSIFKKILGRFGR